MTQPSSLSESQIREIIGRVVRDPGFANALAEAESAAAFLQVLNDYGYEPSKTQAQEIRENLEALQSAANTLDFGAEFIKIS